MAKTLVIQGANYATNKLDKVVFADVPCTGISFQSSTIAINGYESSTINYTVTPSDTTDEIVWASSDENVVTVLDGVVTGTGIGTATITATCGRYSATATVTVSITYIPNWEAIYLNVSSSGTVTSSAATVRVVALGTGSQATENHTVPSDSSDPKCLIKIPSGINHIRVSIPSTSASLFDNNNVSYVMWCKDEDTHEFSADGIRRISSESTYNIRTAANQSKVFAIPSGVDAFAFITKLATAPSASGNVNTEMAATGIQIEFLTENPAA